MQCFRQFTVVVNDRKLCTYVSKDICKLASCVEVCISAEPFAYLFSFVWATDLCL